MSTTYALDNYFPLSYSYISDSASIAIEKTKSVETQPKTGWPYYSNLVKSIINIYSIPFLRPHETEKTRPIIASRTSTASFLSTEIGMDILKLIYYIKPSSEINMIKDIENMTLLDVVVSYSKIKEVRSIYFQKYLEEIQIYVLIKTNRYDYDLMDKLMDVEYEIRNKNPDLIFEFFYPPADMSKKEDFIHPLSQCIYMSE